MDYNFHTHTWRCSHATGTEEEYLVRAIENGIRYMGFSDHIPFRCPDGYEAVSVRVPVDQAEDYCRDLRRLRDKYKDQVELYIGFESEYYPEQFAAMLDDAKRWGAEYLILGQHYTKPEHPNGKHANTATADVDELKRYAQSLIAAMETGVFTYVAHPDVLRFTGDEAVYCDVMREVCVASRLHDVPLELNFYGIRDHRHYPRESFWKTAGEEHSPVTFGFDSHDVRSAYDGESLLTAQRLVEAYHLNYIGKPQIIFI